MTPSDKKLRELAEKATPGPWAIESCGEKGDGSNMVGRVFPWSEEYADEPQALSGWLRPFDDDGNEIEYFRDELVAECAHSNWNSNSDAAYIAACDPQTILTLLSDKEAAEASVAVLVNALERFRDFVQPEICKDEFAYDRLVANYKDSAAAYLNDLPASTKSHLEYVERLEGENAELKEEYRKLEILWKDACVGREANDALWMSAEAKLKKAEADLAAAQSSYDDQRAIDLARITGLEADLIATNECVESTRELCAEQIRNVAALEKGLAKARANARTPGTVEVCTRCGYGRNHPPPPFLREMADGVWKLCDASDCPIRQSRSATSGGEQL